MNDNNLTEAVYIAKEYSDMWVALGYFILVAVIFISLIKD